MTVGRKSQRRERRGEILQAMRRVLGRQGLSGTSVAAIADEAEVSPGLLHHHFENKAAMMNALFKFELQRFAKRFGEEVQSSDQELLAYCDAALSLEGRSDTLSAKVWVGLLAAALRRPGLRASLKRALDTEIERVRRFSGGVLTDHQASAVIAFIIGSLVFGAFSPNRAKGFAATELKSWVQMLLTAKGETLD